GAEAATTIRFAREVREARAVDLREGVVDLGNTGLDVIRTAAPPEIQSGALVVRLQGYEIGTFAVQLVPRMRDGLSHKCATREGQTLHLAVGNVAACIDHCSHLSWSSPSSASTQTRRKPTTGRPSTAPRHARRSTTRVGRWSSAYPVGEHGASRATFAHYLLQARPSTFD